MSPRTGADIKAGRPGCICWVFPLHADPRHRQQHHPPSQHTDTILAPAIRIFLFRAVPPPSAVEMKASVIFAALLPAVLAAPRNTLPARQEEPTPTLPPANSSAASATTSTASSEVPCPTAPDNCLAKKDGHVICMAGGVWCRYVCPPPLLASQREKANRLSNSLGAQVHRRHPWHARLLPHQLRGALCPLLA